MRTQRHSTAHLLCNVGAPQNVIGKQGKGRSDPLVGAPGGRTSRFGWRTTPPACLQPRWGALEGGEQVVVEAANLTLRLLWGHQLDLPPRVIHRDAPLGLLK